MWELFNDLIKNCYIINAMLREGLELVVDNSNEHLTWLRHDDGEAAHNDWNKRS